MIFKLKQADHDKNHSNHINNISIMTLKILIFLHYSGKNAPFINILKYINRSKSQLSVALKKMEIAEYITKSNTRPLIISMKKKGALLRQDIIKDLLKFRKVKRQTIISKKERKNHLLNKKQEIYHAKPNSLTERMKVFDLFIHDVRLILKRELNEYFENRIPCELLKDIIISISHEIHNKLFEYFSNKNK